MKDKALKLLPREFSELARWIESICRRGKIGDFIIYDYKIKDSPRLNLKLFTKNYTYSISARLPDVEKLGKGEMLSVNGYLGCQVQTRKPRAGEDWNRGNDLADGNYSEETWREIVNDILEHELVKVVRYEKPKQIKG